MTLVRVTTNFRLLLPMAIILSLLALAIAPRPAAAVQALLVAELSGEAEVDDQGTPNQGDPNGEGIAFVAIDSDAGELCYLIEVTGIEPATAAHIHEGAAGTNGDIVIELDAPDADGFAEDCLTGQDAALLEAIANNPAGYYVNVHNADFPNGAVRGQLQVGEAGCVLFVSTEDDPGGESVTATVGEEVFVEGFFVGDAEVLFTFLRGEEDLGQVTVTADAEGFASFSVVFEPGEEGDLTVLGTVEGTECAAEAAITVVAAPAAPTPSPTPAAPAPTPAAPALPDTAVVDGHSESRYGAILVVAVLATLVVATRLAARRSS